MLPGTRGDVYGETTAANRLLRGREQLDWLLTQKPIGAYVGVDPTAPSMHVGHLLPFMALFWLYLSGYTSVILVSAISRPMPTSLVDNIIARNGYRFDRRSIRANDRARTPGRRCPEDEHTQYAQANQSALDPREVSWSETSIPCGDQKG